MCRVRWQYSGYFRRMSGSVNISSQRAAKRTGSTVRPVSSRTSRATASSMVSYTCCPPPGRSKYSSPEEVSQRFSRSLPSGERRRALAEFLIISMDYAFSAILKIKFLVSAHPRQGSVMDFP